MTDAPVSDAATTLAVAARPAPKSPRREVFNRSVHGARGLFAGVVILFHMVNSGLPTWPILQSGPIDFLLRTSSYGVELFFCISGFVIVGTLRRAAGPAGFMEDRAIRIYPVLWTTILVIVAMGVASGGRGYGAVFAAPGDWLREMAWLLPVNLLGLPGVLPWPTLHPAAWSLSYELFFYGFCALAWALCRWLGWRTGLALAVPLGVAMIVLTPRAMLFGCGVAVALGVGRWPPLARLARFPVPFLLGFLLLWRLIQVLSHDEALNDTTLIEWAADWRLPLALLAIAMATIGFAGIVAEGGATGRVLRSPGLQFMGTISYSFYLWHPIVMAVLKQAMLRSGLVEIAGQASQLLFLVLALPPSLLVGWVSQRILERRAGAWLRRRRHHRASLMATAEAAGAPIRGPAPDAAS